MLLIITVVVAFFYFLMILIFSVGWKNSFTYEPKGNDSLDIMISVVVACKNEDKTLRSLISAVAQQSYQNFELIIVNDHSTDSTYNFAKNAQKTFQNLVLINAVGHGKKNALKEGIQNAKADLIVTTDADCIPSFLWLESIASFQKRYDCDLIICPVGIHDNETIFSRVQALEFVSLVGVAAGSAGAGMPILCNGANLAFKKESWFKSSGNLHPEQQSGDDIFLLESMKKRGEKIRFLKSEVAFVKTKQAKSLLEFLKQRRRWASKSGSYSDLQLISVACLVFIICALQLTLLAFSFDYLICAVLGSSLFVFKYALDTYFLYRVRRFFQLDNIWIYALILSVLYPFYIVFVSVSSLLFKPKNWN